MSRLVGIAPPINANLVRTSIELPPMATMAPITVAPPMAPKAAQKQMMMILIVLGVLLLVVMMSKPEHMLHENCFVRLVATYKNEVALALAILIMIVVLRIRKIGNQFTRWVPFLPEGYVVGSHSCQDCNCSQPWTCNDPTCCEREGYEQMKVKMI
jgi:hypothetical protein